MQGPMVSLIDIKMWCGGGSGVLLVSCGGMGLGCKRQKCLDKEKKNKGSEYEKLWRVCLLTGLCGD